MDGDPFADRITVTSVQSDVQEILKDLASETIERIGGAVCNVATGQIIAFFARGG